MEYSQRLVERICAALSCQLLVPLHPGKEPSHSTIIVGPQQSKRVVRSVVVKNDRKSAIGISILGVSRSTLFNVVIANAVNVVPLDQDPKRFIASSCHCHCGGQVLNCLNHAWRITHHPQVA